MFQDDPNTSRIKNADVQGVFDGTGKLFDAGMLQESQHADELARAQAVCGQAMSRS